MGPRALIVDTNVFIACEDIDATDIHVGAADAVELHRLANELNFTLYLGRGTREDISRDGDDARRKARLLQLEKWKQLAPVPLDPDLARRAGYAETPNARDRCDLEMIAALEANAVEHLITQDRALRHKAANAGYAGRVMSVPEGVDYLRRLAGSPWTFPRTERGTAYQLSPGDPILASLRGDYPDFTAWFDKVRLEHRPCYIVGSFEGGVEALALLKDEFDTPHDLNGKVLKVCTFKVADEYQGSKRGEALMRKVLEHAAQGDHNAIYVEVYDKHEATVRLFESFGFEAVDAATGRPGELVLVKNRRPDPTTPREPLAHHIAYGPPALRAAPVYIVPVQPRWHDTLFPEVPLQQGLFAPQAHGNAILKAYLSKRQLADPAPGSILLFYRSQVEQAVTVVGVVEEVARLHDAGDVRRFVGLRTVYTDAAIEEMCAEAAAGVLTVRFRQDRVVTPAWRAEQLMKAGVVSAPPQSFQQVRDPRGIQWVNEQLGVTL
jgi:GNAT superfamily N-acetyltransferase